MIHVTSIFIKWENKQNLKKINTFLRTLSLLLVRLLLAALNTQTLRISFFLMLSVWSLRSSWTGRFPLHSDSIYMVTLSSSRVTYFFSSIWLTGKGTWKDMPFPNTTIQKWPVRHPNMLHLSKDLSLSSHQHTRELGDRVLELVATSADNVTSSKGAHISCVSEATLL